MSVEVLHGNALALPLPNDSVDLVVTSPPYFGLRSYQDGGEHYSGQVGDESTPEEFIDSLVTATAEMSRVLKSTGSIWVNLGDKYASNAPGGRTGSSLEGASQVERRGKSHRRHPVPPKSLYGLPWRYALRCIDELGLILRAEVIWSKTNGMPESVTDRVRRSHETWFHFTREPRYFAAADSIREGHVAPSRTPGARSMAGRTIGSPPTGTGQWQAPHPLGKLPGSVWEVATQPLQVPAELGIDHYAAFPMEFPRRLIRGWCPEAGTVLDSFGGTGTTALVAHALGRHGISLDLSEDYCRLARWRISDPAQLAAAMQVAKPDAAPDGMESLLDLISTSAQETA